jgi:hypothetical protein
VTVVQARHVIAAKSADAISTETSDATAVKAADATATEAAHVASAEATHVTTAEAATAVSSASAAPATAGLCTGGKKAAGKHCACQNHHHSSSHDILHLRWADVGVSQQNRTNIAMDWRWECLSVVSTKLTFIRIEGTAM